jgi:nucleoside-specific outer membrane channel protein Tsx
VGRFIAVWGLVVLALARPAAAFTWNTNDIVYTWGPSFREPANTQAISKSVLTFTHADGWAYGTNFINVDILFSDDRDPRQSGGGGAREIYVVDRHDLDLAKIAGGKWSFGPVKTVMVEVGGDINSKNDVFGSEKRMPVAGLAVAFNVPGFWKLAVLWDKEWSRNGIVGRNVTFASTYRIESAWEIPFAVGRHKLSFEGYADLNGPKGRDGFGDRTVAELLIHAEVMYDLGHLLGRDDSIKVGAGYEYWLNKFGTDHKAVTGALAHTPFVRAAYRFSF